MNTKIMKELPREFRHNAKRAMRKWSRLGKVASARISHRAIRQLHGAIQNKVAYERLIKALSELSELPRSKQ